jgi:hypothetical protein
MQAVANGIPVYYQIPVVDGTGNVVQRLPIERSVRKSSNSGVASLFARLSFKKKSRADIVKLVASGDLVPAQLVQIKSAIEKGLTESQLVELINNNISAEKNANLSDVTISKKLIIEENDHAVKTRVPGTWGEEARYVWLRKENIMEIHGGKTMLTFLDSTKDYKLYDEQNRVVTTQKGTELYTHYDKVESSVRERYEKVQKQQKKTTQKKTVTTKKAR